ncbi:MULTISPECIES: hypothetical protein [unclassified Capnocytophaga]|nr:MULTISPECIES: hypothetical protein [unclassified Capnocytophaga]MEB3003867.1 hypothetical protein [Capnocytophaga sp. G2]
MKQKFMVEKLNVSASTISRNSPKKEAALTDNLFSIQFWMIFDI